MEATASKFCPHCKIELRQGDSVIVCPSCGVPHHEACWNQNHGCATPGCPQHQPVQPTEPTVLLGQPTEPAQPPVQPAEPPVQPAEPPVQPTEPPVQPTQPANDDLCAVCGAPMAGGQFCPQCGAPRAAAPKNVCGKCGAQLAEGQEFCPQCGQKAGVAVEPGVASAIDQFNAGVSAANDKKKKSKAPMIIGIVAGAVVTLVILLIVVGGFHKRPDFKALYNEYCSSTWAKVGSDGSYLYIDTNPFDRDDDGLAYPAAYTAIKNVNKALKLPDSLTNDMGETRGLDGKQSRDFDDVGVSVTWSYHPDHGLEVTYRKK